jgi:hypothetical protein
MNVTSERLSTDKGYRRLRYITDLKKVWEISLNHNVQKWRDRVRTLNLANSRNPFTSNRETLLSTGLALLARLAQSRVKCIYGKSLIIKKAKEAFSYATRDK